MKKYIILLSIITCLPSTHMHPAITSQQCAQYYCLVVKARVNNNCSQVAIIPGASLITTNQYHLEINDFKFSSNLYDSICATWQDLEKPESLGCYQIKAINKRNEPYRYFLELPLNRSDEKAQERFSIVLDSFLQYEDAVLVFNELCTTCNPAQYLQSVAGYSADELDKYLTSNDEEEIEAYFKEQQEPSVLTIYAKKIGLTLFLHYLACKEYISEKLLHLKHTIAHYYHS